MSLDHDAIYKAYSNTIRIDDDLGVFDKDGNKITLEQSKIDAARVELSKLDYKDKRVAEYPTIQDQLDMQYWDKKNGTTTWVDAIAKVKSDNPKP